MIEQYTEWLQEHSQGEPQWHQKTTPLYAAFETAEAMGLAPLSEYGKLSQTERQAIQAYRQAKALRLWATDQAQEKKRKDDERLKKFHADHARYREELNNRYKGYSTR